MKKKFEPRPPRGPRECTWCGVVHDNVLHSVNPFCKTKGEKGEGCKQAEKYARMTGRRKRCTSCGRSVPTEDTYYGKCSTCREEA